MDGAAQGKRRWSATAAVVLAAAVAVPALQGCSTEAAVAAPLTAELNQFRDNYGRQIIEIQLSNTSSVPLTIFSAEVSSSLFPAGTSWRAMPEGTEVPPGQTKSLPAMLPAPACGSPGADADADTSAGAAPAEVKVSFRQGSTSSDVHLPAADPFGVLPRNRAELCLAQEAGRIARMDLAPELEVAADGRTAVVRLQVTPRAPEAGTPRTLTIESVEGTTLLAEAPNSPWPRGVMVAAGGSPGEFRLRFRPARCDPHAVAEDKVGTLLPLRLDVGGRRGVFKVPAGAALTGRIHAFVTAACTAH
ncbi:hypothetical protein LJR078_002209 [Arthrobacter sp. LjRoot78]|uniref:hypothetical protein n=1 Tax=Arthrobacter sp. LjRoot78 TaxID=3342338 RepID=UPI003ECD37B0